MDEFEVYTLDGRVYAKEDVTISLKFLVVAFKLDIISQDSARDIARNVYRLM